MHVVHIYDMAIVQGNQVLQRKHTHNAKSVSLNKIFLKSLVKVPKGPGDGEWLLRLLPGCSEALILWPFTWRKVSRYTCENSSVPSQAESQCWGPWILAHSLTLVGSDFHILHEPRHVCHCCCYHLETNMLLLNAARLYRMLIMWFLEKWNTSQML